MGIQPSAAEEAHRADNQIQAKQEIAARSNRLGLARIPRLGHKQAMEHLPQPPATGTIGDFARRVLAGAIIIAVLLAIWEINQVLVLAFGGVVVAVILRTLSAPVQHYLRASDHVALLITTIGLLALAIAFFAIFGAMAVDQFSALLNEIPGAVAAGRKWLQSYTEGRWFLALLRNTDAPSGATLLEPIPLAGVVLGRGGDEDHG